jgi:hypothetical protein
MRELSGIGFLQTGMESGFVPVRAGVVRGRGAFSPENLYLKGMRECNHDYSESAEKIRGR